MRERLNLGNARPAASMGRGCERRKACKATLALAFGLALSLAACDGQTAEAGAANDGDQPLLAASIAPQRYLLKRLLGEDVEIIVVVPPGGNPHVYEPHPALLQKLSRAQAYVRIGIEFESAWLRRFRAANPDLRVLDGARNVEWLYGDEGKDEPALQPVVHGQSTGRDPAGGDHTGHSHAGGHAMDSEDPANHAGHGPGQPNPHHWLSPPQFAAQARALEDDLIQLYPARAERIRSGARELLEEIESLDQELEKTFKGREIAFVSYHPSWAYFARRYNLEMIAVERGGREPAPADLAEVIKTARNAGAQALFVQPGFSLRQARAVARELPGCEIVEIDPLAEAWPTVLRRAAAELTRSAAADN